MKLKDRIKAITQGIDSIIHPYKAFRRVQDEKYRKKLEAKK